jgi:hypothetical protein
MNGVLNNDTYRCKKREENLPSVGMEMNANGLENEWWKRNRQQDSRRIKERHNELLERSTWADKPCAWA